METRQLEHEGFEHVDEFRMPRPGETYQACNGEKSDQVGHVMEYIHGGKRWILRKKDVPAKCPTCGSQFIGKPAMCGNVDCGKRPAQKCFAGFEHTGQYRCACKGEWIQTTNVGPQARHADVDTVIPVWILRKTQEKVGNPQQAKIILDIENKRSLVLSYLESSVEKLKQMSHDILNLKEAI